MSLSTLTSQITTSKQDDFSSTALQELLKSKMANVQLNREKTVPTPAVTGGTGDPDLQRFLTDELKNHRLIQTGAGTDSSGQLALLQKHESYRPERGRIYEETTPIIVDSAATSSWGQQYIRGGINTPARTFLEKCKISVWYRLYSEGEPSTSNQHYNWQRFFKYVKTFGYLTAPYEVYTENCFTEDGEEATDPDFPYRWQGRQ